MNSYNILVGGEAGQGLVTVGQLLAKSLVRAGYHIVVTQSYQSRIRGGHNTYAIRVSTNEIAAPAETVDLLIALDPDTLALHRDEMSGEGLIVLDEALAVPEDVGADLLKVPYKELATGKSMNVAALGIAASLLGLSQDSISTAVDESFGKHPEAAEGNSKALSSAFEWTAAQGVSRALPAPQAGSRRLMMNGNDAIALGTLSAGVKFCSFYPMTPATSIVLNLASNAKRMGVAVEQAEDEIAAINMAVGAAYAGAPSMVATSGGGFALMVEGISLAAMTETPIVVALAQRPGPATGLPTRTEQADLEFVLYSGHGEFPRAIFAPGTIEECFHLTRKAFDLAEKYQSPIFVLTDQFLADSYRAIEPFDIEGLEPVRAGLDEHAGPETYLRYRVTESGVSPRLLPGVTEHLVVTDSDEHTEDGHLTEDLVVRNAMQEKRMRKIDGILSEVLPPSYEGSPKPEVLFVTWGSSHGSVSEAARRISETGTSTGVLNFSQVWPLVPEQFLPRLQSAGRVVCVEGNATGQFANLLRRECGFEIQGRVLRYDGLPITPGYVLNALGSDVE